MATPVCPSAGAQGGFGGSFVYSVGPMDATCGADSAVTLSIPTNSDYAKLEWTPPAYPGTVTLGNLGGINAGVAYSASAGDMPFYELSFYDPSDSVGQGSAGDQILLIEFQPSTVSGSAFDVDAGTTLFNLYDNTTGTYLEGGQADAQTLDYWLGFDPSLDADSLAGFRIGMGLAGGCATTCTESLTINTINLTETPEPGSIALFGTGLVSMAGLARRRFTQR
jgi:PEP-CTERM motif